MNIKELLNKWTKHEIDEVYLLNAFTTLKDAKDENKFLLCISLSDLATELYEDEELSNDHDSYQFLNLSKKKIMDKLKISRVKTENILSYLEGANLIKINKGHTLKMELTSVGTSYCTLLWETEKGKKLYNQLIR